MSDRSSVVIPVWDVWVRLFHWSLVGAVAFQVLSGLTGWQFFEWHRRIGEFVLMLVLFRVLWGFVGSSNARFSTLLQSPVAALRKLGALARGDSEPERRHDAAGAWAVIALLTLLSVQALTGMFIADEDEFVEGAWYGVASGDLTDTLYRVHRWNADLLQILIVVHVLAVGAYYLRAHRNLVAPMIHGRMAWPADRSIPPLHLQRRRVGAVVLIAALGVVGLVAGWFDGVLG